MAERDRPAEQEAITTTIVGGRPPGCGQPVGAIPRGVEVLVKKAAVDPAFRERLLDQRAQAADEIGLTLQPPEALMLQAVPREQLERIIDHTRIRPEHKPVFLGKVAALMLLAVGAQTLGCSCTPATDGIRPDHPQESQSNAEPLIKSVVPPPESSEPIPPAPAKVQEQADDFRTYVRKLAAQAVTDPSARAMLRDLHGVPNERDLLRGYTSIAGMSLSRAMEMSYDLLTDEQRRQILNEEAPLNSIPGYRMRFLTPTMERKIREDAAGTEVETPSEGETP